MQEEFEQYYKTLRLPRGADATRLRAAYKELAQRWHPDRQHDPHVPREASEAIFKEITRAYAVLTRYHRAHRAMPFEYDMEPTPVAWPELQAANSAVALPRKGLIAGAATAFGVALILAVYFSLSPSTDSQIMEELPLPSIEIGDSQEEVLEALGRPTYLSRSRWQYGMSEVYFEDGRVSGWHNAKQTPLASAED